VLSGHSALTDAGRPDLPGVVRPQRVSGEEFAHDLGIGQRNGFDPGGEVRDGVQIQDSSTASAWFWGDHFQCLLFRANPTLGLP
jgi:hypothetical protein